MAVPRRRGPVLDNRPGQRGGRERFRPPDRPTEDLPEITPLTVGFADMSTHFRVTYATLSAENEELHAAYEAGLRLARSWLGATVPAYIGGQPRDGGKL